MSDAPRLISIIIPCLNEAGTVEHLLDQFEKQSRPEIEIIAVDNRSDDVTLKVLQRYVPAGMKVAKDVPRGIANARNAGAKLASGRWLIFLDADSLLPANFTTDITERLKNEANFTLAALAYRAKTHNALFKLLTWSAQAYQRISFRILGTPLVPGSMMVVRADVHAKIGGFDKNVTYNEDFEYSKRAYAVSPHFKSLHSPFVYFSTRRLEHGGWRSVIATYFKAETARMLGKTYQPEQYDMTNHRMKK